jgi:FkbM family methyltransferase
MRYPAWLPVTNEASHTFVPSLMADRPVVLDLGANEGEFYDAFLRRFTPGRYIAVEPTETLAAKMASRNIHVAGVAVARLTGPVMISLESNSEASSILTAGGNRLVEGVTYADLLERETLERIDLVKMDIEGAEMFALGDSDPDVLRLATQITVEMHDFCGIINSEQVQGLITRMRQCGFNGIRFSNNNTDWLFVRHDEISKLRWASVVMMALVRRGVHRVRGLRSGG